MPSGPSAWCAARRRNGSWTRKRIGILGFSAGGHLAAAASTNYDKRAYESIDDVDKVSCRPDFAVLVYPAYLVGQGQGDTLTPDIRVTKDSPPHLLRPRQQ